MSIAEIAYCGAMYKDALRTLEGKFGQTQAVVSAHLDKLNSFPPLKMHNSDNTINYSVLISSLVWVFNSLLILLNAVFLRKRPGGREPRSWLRQSSVSLVCVINICSGSAKVPLNVEKMVATAPILPYFTELKGFFPVKPSTNNNMSTSKLNAGTSKPYSGQQQPSKTTTWSSVMDVKGLLQVTELKLTNTSGTSTTALVLCDTACSNSWMSNSPTAGLALQRIALKLTAKGINTEKMIDTKVVQLTVTPHKDQDFGAFTIRPYVKETLNVGSDILDVKSIQETYPHLTFLDPVRYSYGEIEMILVRMSTMPSVRKSISQPTKSAHRSLSSCP